MEELFRGNIHTEKSKRSYFFIIYICTNLITLVPSRNGLTKQITKWIAKFMDCWDVSISANFLWKN